MSESQLAAAPAAAGRPPETRLGSRAPTRHSGRGSGDRLRAVTLSGVAALLLAWAAPALALNIRVDYRYDTNNFFNTDAKRAPIEKAAQRYSDLITTSLAPATLNDTFFDERIGFTHPTLGTDWDVSSAPSQAEDSLAGNGVAQEYRGPWSIAQDEWILYVGARSLDGPAGLGGSGTGLNYTPVFDDPNSHLNRGFRSVGSTSNLPLWGGVITFDDNTNWTFDLETSPTFGQVDLYSIALHEIGHALGLNIRWDEWTQWQSGPVFSGPKALEAYNDFAGTSLTSLQQVNASNWHYADGVYDAPIFAAADPVLPGTVGLGAGQDLLMEPIANFGPGQRRIEITTVDAAALQDVGWDVIADAAPVLVGDYNDDNVVDAADYTIWRDSTANGPVIGSYAEWSANYGTTLATAVPEPATIAAGLTALFGLSTRRP
ncbi:MAG: matrixin family metalloprotease [Planctomycetota bacterium]